MQESFLDAERDVQFGWAVFDNELNEWQKNWGEEIPGVGGYNLIGVTMRRSVLGSTKGDGPLPLIFAPVLGRTYSTLETTAAAVIMPAKGVNVGNGENATSDVLPFVIHKRLWEKYRRAQAYYETHGIPTDPLDVRDIMDNETNNYRGTEPTGEPLFGHWVPVIINLPNSSRILLISGRVNAVLMLRTR